MKKEQHILEFSKLIDVQIHIKSIEREVRKIKAERLKISNSAEEYFEELVSFFLTDIQDFTEEIYSTIILKKKTDRINFSTDQLSRWIHEASESCINAYTNSMQAYSMGGMFREHRNFEEEVKTLENRAREIFKKQSQILCLRYEESEKEQKDRKWTLGASIIAAIASVLSVLFSIIGGKPPIIPC